MAKQKIGGAGKKKIGRCKVYCNIYRLSHRREHNKLRWLKKHCSNHPADDCSAAAVDRCNRLIRGH